jgi:hypothetical protein
MNQVGSIVRSVWGSAWSPESRGRGTGLPGRAPASRRPLVGGSQHLLVEADDGSPEAAPGRGLVRDSHQLRVRAASRAERTAFSVPVLTASHMAGSGEPTAGLRRIRRADALDRYVDPSAMHAIAPTASAIPSAWTGVTRSCRKTAARITVVTG